jgi:hypothetical protein
MHRDSTDRPILKGDFIAYSGGTGRRSSGLRFALVVALKEKSTEKHVFNQATQNYDKVPETEYKIQVVSAENRRRYDYTNKKWLEGWGLQGKDLDGNGKARLATLDRLERVIVIEPHQIQPEARAMLEQEKTERGIL